MLLERIKERAKKFDLTLSDVAEKTGSKTNPASNQFVLKVIRDFKI